MINRLTLQSIINKYHLGSNESVIWEIKDKVLTINFMSETKDLIGTVTYEGIPLEDSKLAIYDTKKLLGLISITSEEVLVSFDGEKETHTKLFISDQNFDLTYALSSPFLIPQVGTVNIPQWVVNLELTPDEIDNLIKAKNALTGIDNMIIQTNKLPGEEPSCEFIFGDESGFTNKINYKLNGDIQNTNLKFAFSSDWFKSILYTNKDMENPTLSISEKGLLKFEFNNTSEDRDKIHSTYYLLRKADNMF